MTIAIQAENLSKKYVISHRQSSDTLRDELAALVRRLGRGLTRSEYEEFWALRDVSFKIRQGERVGIIGRNGAGKSTLLKILSRITEPTTGRVLIRGRVASLLEVGTGFHPELTGRENIFLNGAILGMKRGEIRRKFDEIIAFAEVEKFLDTPVKRYSSGMYVRLAFAVAAHLEPEILIVDEVLAVGDAAFQKKCLEKMNRVGEEGTTVLFVSHNIAAIQSICSTAILLGGGRLIGQGDVNSVVHQYLAQSEQLVRIPLAERSDRSGTGAIRFTSFELRDAQGREVSAYYSGQHVKMLFRFVAASDRNLRNAVFAVRIDSEAGQRLTCFYNEIGEDASSMVPGSTGCIEIEIKKLPLVAGTYRLALYCSINQECADSITDAGHLIIEKGDFHGTGKLPPVASQGSFHIQHQFRLHHSVQHAD